jgi:hypothetical protein
MTCFFVQVQDVPLLQLHFFVQEQCFMVPSPQAMLGTEIKAASKAVVIANNILVFFIHGP